MALPWVDPAWVRSQLIGRDAPIHTLFGERRIVYADHVASGRSPAAWLLWKCVVGHPETRRRADLYRYAAREGTTHGAERRYHAFIGGAFGVDIVDGYLRSTVVLATALPEPGTWSLLLVGLASILGYRVSCHR